MILSKLRITVAAALVCVAALSFNTRAGEDPSKPWKLVNAEELRIINKAWPAGVTERKYSRLPASIKDSVRSTLWDRQQCSAGIGVRFATNSSRIGVKYRLFLNTHMIHMADTGLKGTDLYIFQGDSVWRHVNTNRPYISKNYPADEKICESVYVENLDGGMHEYMVYFPLYDGIEDLWIKVDSGAVITPGRPELIDRSKGKIIAYGTSILQGGCASRTGMAATNIMSRELNREIVNLGFSGDGKMDPVMAREMAKIPDAAMFFLDPVPNCTEMMCDTLTYGFVSTLRRLRPEVPVVMLEGPMYPYYRQDSNFGTYLPKKNAAFRKNYEKLKAENPENLYYIDSVDLDGVEDDGTVDGIHLTDLGFRHYADKIGPILKAILDGTYNGTASTLHETKDYVGIVKADDNATPVKNLKKKFPKAVKARKTRK